MVSLPALLLSLTAGATAGTAVLGLGGRLLMSALVVLRGGHPSFSLDGSMEVVLVGGIYGMAGGLLLLPLRRACRRMPVPAGALMGLLLFGSAWLTSSAGRGAAAGLDAQLPLALGLAALAFLAYGLLTEALYVRWSARRAASPE